MRIRDNKMSAVTRGNLPTQLRKKANTLTWQEFKAKRGQFFPWRNVRYIMLSCYTKYL
jgi:hypothetical protein